LEAYAAQIVCGSVKLLVHHDAQWVSLNQLDQFDFCPADIAIIERLKELKQIAGSL
jgi:8-oxo-dGTP diphosphatase